MFYYSIHMYQQEVNKLFVHVFVYAADFFFGYGLWYVALTLHHIFVLLLVQKHNIPDFHALFVIISKVDYLFFLIVNIPC